MLAPMRSPCKYVYDYSFFAVFFRFGFSVRSAERESSVEKLRLSGAVFGGRFQRPSPCRVRSAPRREHG